MTAHQDKYGGVVFSCDGCLNTYDTGERLWKDAWLTVSKSGWRAFKSGQDWQHRCEMCVYLMGKKAVGANAHLAQPPESIKPMPQLVKHEHPVYDLVFSAVDAALSKGAPGLAPAVRRAIAGKVGLDLKDKMVAPSESLRLRRWIDRIDGHNDNPANFDPYLDQMITAARNGEAPETWVWKPKEIIPCL